MFHESPKRHHRVAQQLQKELAELLISDVKDPRVGFVTVTEVRLSEDLKHAQIYVSVYGPKEQRQQSLSGLQAASGYLQSTVAHKLGLRFTPHLSFSLDETLDEAERLETLVNAANTGQTDIPSTQAQTFSQVDTERSALIEKRQVFQRNAKAVRTKHGRNTRR